MAILLSRVISDVDNDWLTGAVTLDEVSLVVKQIGPLKTHGPNDMHALFYQQCWSVTSK